MDNTVTRLRVEQLLDERETVNNLHENTLAQVQSRHDKTKTDVEEKQLTGYRERATAIDAELAELEGVLESDDRAAKTNTRIRGHLAAQMPGVVLDNGAVTYKSFSAYARDKIVTKYHDKLGITDTAQVETANERLMRAPQHTLSEDVEGLQPPQHIAQIMDVINTTRPVIATAVRVNLNRGKITYPKITQRPEVLLQATEKSEGGTAEMIVELEDETAKTFIGGGNLSWQAIEWSDPSALDLWFRLQGEAYAQKTEGSACAVLAACAAAGGTADAVITGGTADTFADVIAAVVGGAAIVYTNSGAMANTLYLSPDVYFTMAALTTDSGAPFITAGNLDVSQFTGRVAGLRVVASPGFGTATAFVGDSKAFIVGESPNAPVQLRAVEPAIGGLEVGVIGAMAAVCFDSARFAVII